MLNSLIVIGSFILLLALNVPISFSLGISSFFYLLFLSKVPLLIQAQRMAGSLDSFVLLAVPFFILAARLMNEARLTDRLFEFAKSIVGHVRGGMAHVNILGSMIFAGMSGSALADAAGLGRVEIKAMVNDGYDPGFSAAVTAASSTVGPIIPPSIGMVLYAMLVEESVGRLFLGGVIPGVLMVFSTMVLVVIIAWRRKYPRSPRSSLKMFFKSFCEAFLSLMTPVILLGGIVLGIFTPTEAAAIAALYALILGTLVYRELGFNNIIKILGQTGIETAVLLFIYVNASIFSWVITAENFPQLVEKLIVGLTSEKWVVLLIINIIFLIAGCFLDPVPLMLILVPVVLPLLVHFQIDLIHFGIIMMVNLMIGMITPPFGLCLFAVTEITQIPFVSVVRAILPFYFPLITILFLITYVDQLVLFLPNVLMGR